MMTKTSAIRGRFLFLYSFLIFSLIFSGCGSQNTQDRADVKPPLKKEQKAEPLLYQQGLRYLNEGRVKEAVVTLGKAVQENPRNTDAYFLLSQIYINLKEYELAQRYLMAIIQMEPDNGEAFLMLGGCFDSMGKKEDAFQSVERSLTIFRDKQDSKNFKKAMAVLQVLKNAG